MIRFTMAICTWWLGVTGMAVATTADRYCGRERLFGDFGRHSGAASDQQCRNFAADDTAEKQRRSSTARSGRPIAVQLRGKRAACRAAGLARRGPHEPRSPCPSTVLAAVAGPSRVSSSCRSRPCRATHEAAGITAVVWHFELPAHGRHRSLRRRLFTVLGFQQSVLPVPLGGNAGWGFIECP